jgi:hypothetical protein
MTEGVGCEERKEDTRSTPARGLGPKAAGVLAMSLAPAVGARVLRLVAAMGGALAALTDVLQWVLDLGQPAAQVGVLRLQVGDPLLKGGEEGQNSGLTPGGIVFQRGAGIGGGGAYPLRRGFRTEGSALGWLRSPVNPER